MMMMMQTLSGYGEGGSVRHTGERMQEEEPERERAGMM